MKIAVIGSRDLQIDDMGLYLPKNTAELVSGGARGIDQCARSYALKHEIKLTEFLPDYKRYGRTAPLKRNDEIVDYADAVIAFWNGKSAGTKYVIERCKKMNKEIKVYII